MSFVLRQRAGNRGAMTLRRKAMEIDWAKVIEMWLVFGGVVVMALIGGYVGGKWFND